jgi:hypothetical protein
LAAVAVGCGSAPEPPHRFQSVVDLFEADAPLRIDQVSYARGAADEVAGRFLPERTMRLLELEFTSQVYRGVECRHRAVALLPAGGVPDTALGTAAIVLGGGLLEAEDPQRDWIEHVVLGLGVPVIDIMEAFDARLFGARNPGELMSFGDLEFMRTGDARQGGYYALAKIFSAAATVAGDLEEIRARRFIVTGGSKGGMAALIACAGDARIVGAFPTAWNSGNVLEYTRLKGERWGWDVKPKQTGPAGETARSSLEMLSSQNGGDYLRLFDPAQWGDLLADTFVMPAVGTNDPLFHLLTDRYYYDELKCRKAFLRVPNYGHGREHALHASAWRFAVAAALLDREIPSVRLVAVEEDGGVALDARIDTTGAPARLEIWHADDPGGDYRRAEWKTHRTLEAAAAERTIRIGHVTPPDSGTSAYFILMFSESPAGDAITSSNVVELGTPVRHQLEGPATFDRSHSGDAG